MKLPIIEAGIAYVFWGPMWRQHGIPTDPEIFRQTIRALRKEYSQRQGLVLRLFPIAFRGKDDQLEEILMEEGYRNYDDGKSHRTLIMDLTPALQEIRANMDRRWRRSLNQAEKKKLEVIQGEEEALFDEIKKIQSEMSIRKGVTDLGDVEQLKKVQRYLPLEYKLKVILCRLNGENHYGAIFSAIGNTAVYLVGATSNAGLKSRSSFINHWTFIKWLKQKKIHYYNLNGINPEINPGTYTFKLGLAGKKGIDVEFIGKFQVADNPLSVLVANCGESLVYMYKRILRKSTALKNSVGQKRRSN